MNNYKKSRSGAKALTAKEAAAILKTLGHLDVMVIVDPNMPPFYVNKKRNFIEFESASARYELVNGKMIQHPKLVPLSEAALKNEQVAEEIGKRNAHKRFAMTFEVA